MNRRRRREERCKTSVKAEYVEENYLLYEMMHVQY